jgi:hypothetical protein
MFPFGYLHCPNASLSIKLLYDRAYHILPQAANKDAEDTAGRLKHTYLLTLKIPDSKASSTAQMPSSVIVFPHDL